MGIIVKRAVRVKAVVTEQLKAQRLADLRDLAARLEADSKALSARIEALRKTVNSAPRMERLEQTLRRNEKAQADAAAELSKTEALRVGDELDRGVLEGFVEVNVGDDFAALVDCEIVVKDDRIVEIRNGRCGGTRRT